MIMEMFLIFLIIIKQRKIFLKKHYIKLYKYNIIEKAKEEENYIDL